MIQFLEHWQTLIGSLIGGIVGLLAALLVAHKERRRDENASAMLLISDLVFFKEAALQALKEPPEGMKAHNNIFSAYRLVKLRPMLSPMFDSSMARVISVDNKLAAHLSHFKFFYSNIAQLLDNLALQFNKEDLIILKDNEYTKIDANKLVNALKLAIASAECSVYLLEELFLNKCAWWIRLTISIRRKWYPTNGDIQSREFLKAETSSL